MTFAIVLLLCVAPTLGLVGHAPSAAHGRRGRPLYAVRDTLDEAKRILEAKLPKDMDRQTGRTGGAVAGAVVGGLILGPLGFLLGGSVGRNFGASLGNDRQMNDKLASLGIDATLLAQAKECAADLAEAKRAIDAAEDASDGNERNLRALTTDRDAAQSAAMDAVRSGDDAAARRYLEGRIALDKRVSRAADAAAVSARCLSTARETVSIIERRSAQIEELIARSVVATQRNKQLALGDSPFEDPLIDKFRALGD